MKAFLDANGNVRVLSKEKEGYPTVSLADAQQRDSLVATEVSGAPDALITIYLAPFKNDQYHRLVTGDGTSIGDYVLVNDLDRIKARYLAQIDRECERRIIDGSGFEWPLNSGNFFSLSLNAQTKWNGLLLAKDVFDYVSDPPKVRTKDDLIEYTIASASEVAQMWSVAMTTVRGYLNSSREAKSNVLAATNSYDAQIAYDDYIASLV